MALFTRDIGDGIRIKVETDIISHSYRLVTRVYVTAVYDYMESDPIFKITVDPSNPASAVRMDFRFEIDVDVVDKNITAFNIYVANIPEAVDGVVNWLDSAEDYKLKETVDATDSWSAGGTLDRYKDVTVNCIADSSAVNLRDILGHEPVLQRERFMPRYITQSRRDQGAITVIDRDDRVLLLSAYSGAGVHEDEKFLDLSVDNQGNPLRVILNSRGELMGYEVLNGELLVFKKTELETFNFQGGGTALYSIDCVAKRSILKTPYGVVWAGRSAIYFLPSDGGGVRVLNENWKNLYDGTWEVSGITDEIREKIISGWDPVMHACLFHIDDTIYRYYFRDGVWDSRFIPLFDEEGS
jgi:hypothetical protein